MPVVSFCISLSFFSGKYVHVYHKCPNNYPGARNICKKSKKETVKYSVPLRIMISLLKVVNLEIYLVNLIFINKYLTKCKQLQTQNHNQRTTIIYKVCTCRGY